MRSSASSQARTSESASSRPPLEAPRPSPSRLLRRALSSGNAQPTAFSGLLLRNLNSVTILGKPYYFPYIYIPIMVTYFKFLIITATQNPLRPRLTESQVWDVETLGIRVFTFQDNPLVTVRNILETALLFAPDRTRGPCDSWVSTVARVIPLNHQDN